MTHRARLSLTAVLCAMLFGASATAANAQECHPGGDAAWAANEATYTMLFNALVPSTDSLKALLDGVRDQASYEALLGAARALVATVPNGRLLIMLPDGHVVLDTSRADGESPANANSYAHFVARSINENHNSRVAIFTAQLFPCGFGLETRVSTTTGNVESAFAARLGAHLNSSGTARLSVALSQ